MSEKRIEAKVSIEPHVWEAIQKIADSVTGDPAVIAGDYAYDGLCADIGDDFEGFTKPWRKAVTKEIRGILVKGGEDV